MRGIERGRRQGNPRKVRFLFRHTDSQRAGEAQPLPLPRMRTRQPLSQTGRQPPDHRLFAIEYHCPKCKPSHRGRFFKKPDKTDLDNTRTPGNDGPRSARNMFPTTKFRAATKRTACTDGDIKNTRTCSTTASYWHWNCPPESSPKSETRESATPSQPIFPICFDIRTCSVAMNKRALKSLDIFSVSRFSGGFDSGANRIFSASWIQARCVHWKRGGWANIVEKFKKAKSYCDRPFEFKHQGTQKDNRIHPMANGSGTVSRESIQNPEGASIFHAGTRGAAELREGVLDAVFTDPPYYGNVQYAELMDFCYVWLRKLAGSQMRAFAAESTRSPHELTGNVDMGRGLDHFADGLSAVFQKMAKALKPGSPLAFTYHHNSIEAYYPVAVAILDAGLTCSASIPCPAEMGASIHINGTGSSILDTVFVCRSTGLMRKQWLANTPGELATVIKQDLDRLRAGNVKPTRGDIRCIAFGHLVRLSHMVS